MPRAMSIIAGALAAVLAVAEPMPPSAWGAANMVVPDGPRAEGKWDPNLAPYVGPIVDMVGPEGTANFVATRKSAQTGLSIAAILLCGTYMDLAPCRIGYAVQSIDALKEFNAEKLAPTIRLTPALRAKVKASISRSGKSSNIRRKLFPGGSLSLINANSARDLRSRTLKVGIADEVDGWADELGDDGDPLDLYKARFTSFHATGDWRLFALSTPLAHGESRIDRLFKAGDQRFWHVNCPGCSEPFAFEFKHLRFERKPPYRAHYVTACCGTIIEHHEKATLVRGGRFVATNAEGLYPSFHVDALISLVTTWDNLVAAWWDAQGDEKKLKAFYNLWLGLPYQMRGDAPEVQRLLERREDYQVGHIPADGLLLVCGADVQHNGIWYEVVAFGADGQSWSIEHRFIEGDTTDVRAGAWLELDVLYDRQFPDAFGAVRQVDAMAVDAGDGGRANQVYLWTRRLTRAFAIKGQPGWPTPAIGTPTKVSIKLNGKKIAGGAMVWPVGTWNLKSTYYSNMRKDGRKAGAEADPPGYCHHHAQCDENYFNQQTAESLVKAKRFGRVVQIWQENAPNHLLDCRVYAMAMADYLGLNRYTPHQWAALRRMRCAPVQATEPDLVTKASTPALADVAAPPARTPLLAGKKRLRKRRILSEGVA